MATQFEIIFKDEGGPAASPAPRQPAPPTGGGNNDETTALLPGPRAQPRVSGPAARGDTRWRGAPTGPAKPNVDPDPLKDLAKAGHLAADALGLGGLTGKARMLIDAWTHVARSSGGPARSGGVADSVGPTVREIKMPRTPPIGIDDIRVGANPLRNPLDGLADDIGPSSAKGLGQAVKMVNAAPKAGGPSVVGPAAATAATTGARGAAVGAAAGAAGSSAAGLASVAAVAGPAAIAIAAVVGLGVAAKKTSDVLHSEANRLSDISPELSAVGAQNDIRAEMADMRRAERIGPNLAIAEDLRGQASAHISDAITEVADLVTEMIADNKEEIQTLVDMLGAVVAGVGLMVANTKSILDIMAMRSDQWAENATNTIEATKKLGKAMNRVADATEEEEDWENDPVTAAFLHQFGFGPAPGRPRPPAMPAAIAPGDGGVAMPVFHFGR